MARLFVNAGSEHLLLTSSIRDAYPVSFAAWFYPDSASDDGCIVSIARSDGNNSYVGMFAFGSVGGDPLYARIKAAPTHNDTLTSVGWTVNAWNHGCAVFNNNTDRRIYLDGGNKVQGTLDYPYPTNLDRTAIGRLVRSSSGDNFSGRIAEVGVWNAALTDDEVAILAKGYSPLFVRPESLIAYIPIIGRNDPELELIQGNNFDDVNGTSAAKHPRIIYPSSGYISSLITNTDKFAIGATWNDTNNWSLTSGGGGGAGVPTASDAVFFDANSVNMAIDVAAVCLSLDSTGYAATLTQNNTFTLTDSGNFTWAAGTFVGGDSNIDINDGNFLQSGGTFTNSSGNMNIERNFDVSGGTFNNSATVTFDGSGSADETTVTFSGTVPGTVDINKTGTASSFTVASGTTISLGASPSTTTFSAFTNNGTITISSGTWTHGGQGSAGGTLTNNGTITHSGDGWDMNNSGLDNKVGSTITYSGPTMSVERIFLQNGTFDTTGITITFDGAGSNDDVVITNPGVLAATVIINKTGAGASVTVASGTTISLAAGPSSTIGNTFINNGTILIPSGTWTLDSVGDATFTNNGTLTHSGSGWVMIDCGLTNNAGATITYSGATMSMDNDFTDDGTFDTTGITLTFVGSASADDTTLFQTSQVFEGNIVVNKPQVLATFTIGSDVTIQGDFTRTNGVFDNPSSAFTLTVEGDFSMSTTDAFGGANLTLKMAGSNDQTFTQNAGTLSCELIWDKSGGTLTQTTAVTNAASRDMTGNNGHWCNNGFDLTIADVLTIDSNATLTEIDGSTISFGSKVGGIRRSSTCVLPTADTVAGKELILRIL